MRAPESYDPALLAELGRRVMARRKAIEPDQKRFTGSVGIDRNYWRRIEGGRQNVSFSTLARVAKVLGITIAELVVGIEEERRQTDVGQETTT